MSSFEEFYNTMSKPQVPDVTVGFSGIDPSTDLTSEEAQKIICRQVQKYVDEGGVTVNVNYDSDEAQAAINSGVANFFNGQNVVLDCGGNS